MHPLKVYSHIRGVCHNPRLDGHKQLETEMGYCQRLQLNSLRFWMLMEEWEKQGESYFDSLEHFMRTAWHYGVSSMPIFWNGNFICEWKDPDDAWYAKAEIYAKAFIDRFVYFNCPENRVKIKDKEAVLVVAFEEDNVETAEPLINMFEKSFEYLEMTLIAKILAPGVGERGDVLTKLEILESCDTLGKKLAI